MRSPILLLLISMLFFPPLAGVAAHNPSLPEPQQIKYGSSRLPVAGLGIGFASDPTEQDRFAAGNLRSQQRYAEAPHQP